MLQCLRLQQRAPGSITGDEVLGEAHVISGVIPRAEGLTLGVPPLPRPLVTGSLSWRVLAVAAPPPQRQPRRRQWRRRLRRGGSARYGGRNVGRHAAVVEKAGSGKDRRTRNRTRFCVAVTSADELVVLRGGRHRVTYHPASIPPHCAQQGESGAAIPRVGRLSK